MGTRQRGTTLSKAPVVQQRATEHIENPLYNRTPGRVIRDAQKFYRRHRLFEKVERRVFVRGALVAKDPESYKRVPGLTRVEREALRSESANSFSKQIRLLTKEHCIILATCCIAAVVQGWDQSSINGANLRWPCELLGVAVDLENLNQSGSIIWTFSGVNAASYLSAAWVGCWLSDPLNEFLYGRRGALFIAGCSSFATVIGAAYAHDWKALLTCRILLGLGLGAKASVVAVYIAETSPAFVRGSLVILWQMFVALGIFLGNAANIVVLDSWRKQLASAFIPALLLLTLVPMCYESPRWLLKKGRFLEAYESLRHLRQTPLQACRDLYYMQVQIQGETMYLNRNHHTQVLGDSPAHFHDDEDEDEDDNWDRNSDSEQVPAGNTSDDHDMYQKEVRQSTYWQRFGQLFTVPRIRRATMASFAVMIGQQLCGINLLAFLSATLFSAATKSDDSNSIENTCKNGVITDLGDGKKALWLSFGFGLANFVFTLPAWGTIDTKGRRWLLNWSFPNMSWTLLALGLCFQIPGYSARIGAMSLFIVFYTAAYSAGEGPVAFTLSSEVFPLVNREVGMSFAVFWNLLGAGILALIAPWLVHALHWIGVLCLFAGLNLVAWVMVFVFVPETAQIGLEEMNAIFEVPTGIHLKYEIAVLCRSFNRHVRRLDEPSLPPLSDWARDHRAHQG